MNDKEKALMKCWAKAALRNEGCDPMRDLVARFIMDNVDDPYEGIEVGSVWIVKVEDEERVAVRGNSWWYLCETDAFPPGESDAVELVSELVPKSTPDHPEVIETEEDYDSVPAGTIAVLDNAYPWVKDYEGLWRRDSEGERVTSTEMARFTRRVLRWGERL